MISLHIWSPCRHPCPSLCQAMGNGGGGQGQWTLGSPPGSPYSPHLTVLVTWENKSICLCTATDKFILSVLLWPEHEYWSINDCSMGKTLHYGRGWGGLGGGGEDRKLSLFASLYFESTWEETWWCQIFHLIFLWLWESGRWQLRVISGEYLAIPVFTCLGPSGLSWEPYCKHCILLAVL